jgi:photosystem II stability/assembly factor-like uncharacterized protein
MIGWRGSVAVRGPDSQSATTRVRKGFGSRASWFLLCVVVLLLFAVAGYRQKGSADPYDPPRFPTLAWWLTPHETNGFERLTFIDANLRDVYAVPGGDDVWAVGTAGTIIHSPDGGTTWEKQKNIRWETRPEAKAASRSPQGRRWLTTAYAAERPQSTQAPKFDSRQQTRVPIPAPAQAAPAPPEPSGPATLNSVYFADRLHGWTVGDRGVILTTSDGGDLWTGQQSPVREILRFVKFDGTGQGIVFSQSWKFTLNTHDGGQTWSLVPFSNRVTVPVQVTVAESPSNAAPNLGRLYAQGGEFVLLSKDPSVVRMFVLPDDLGGFSSIHTDGAVNASTAWVTTQTGAVIETVDGGSTWHVRGGSYPIRPRAVLFSRDRSHGWMAGDAGAVLETHDGGATWIHRTRGARGRFIAVQSSSSGREVRAVAQSGDVYASTDRGAIWKRIAGPAPGNFLTASLSADGRLILAVGNTGTPSAFDAGKNRWAYAGHGLETLKAPLATVGLFAENGPGLAALEDGSLWRTDDARTWRKLPPPPRPFRFLSFFADMKAFGIDRSGAFWRTNDGGTTWNSTEPNPMPSDSVSVHFEQGTQLGWNVDRYGALLASQDNGNNWVPPVSARTWSAPWCWVAAIVVVAVFGVKVLRPPPREVESGIVVARSMLSDRPMRPGDPDPLRLGDTALTVARFLANQDTKPPLTVAIDGRWGSGKSSLMQLIKGNLQEYGFPTVWFNAWHHESEESFLGALMETIRTQAIPPLLSLRGLPFRARLLSIRGKKYILMTLILVFALAAICGAFIGDSSGTSSVLALFSALLSLDAQKLPGTRWTLRLLVPLVVALQSLHALGSAFGSRLTAWIFSGFSVRQFSGDLGFRERFARSLGEVTEALGGRRLTIFIDDLDRCQPAHTMNVLETVNLLMSSGDCYVVMGMDREVVHRSIELGFAVIAGQPGQQNKRGEQGQASPERYLQKLLNIEVPVPVPAEGESVRLLADDDGDGDRDPVQEESPPLRYLLLGAPLRLAWRYGIVPLVLAAAVGGYFCGPNLLRPLKEILRAAETNTPVTGQPAQNPSVSPAIAPGASETPSAALTGARASVTAADLEGDGTISDGRTSRAASTTIAVVILVVVLAIGVRALQFMPRPLERDSVVFKKALRTWHPLLYAQAATPRTIKRFLNEVRFLAMSQLPVRESISVRRRLRRWVGLEGEPAARPAERRENLVMMPEEFLVAFDALRRTHPDWLSNEALWRDPAAFLSIQEGSNPPRGQEERVAALKHAGSLADYYRTFVRMTEIVRAQ